MVECKRGKMTAMIFEMQETIKRAHSEFINGVSCLLLKFC